jgi:hypothetical protein
MLTICCISAVHAKAKTRVENRTTDPWIIYLVDSSYRKEKRGEISYKSDLVPMGGTTQSEVLLAASQPRQVRGMHAYALKALPFVNKKGKAFLQKRIVVADQMGHSVLFQATLAEDGHSLKLSPGPGAKDPGSPVRLDAGGNIVIDDSFTPGWQN